MANKHILPVAQQEPNSRSSVVSCIHFNSVRTATVGFENSVQRLLSVNDWGNSLEMSYFQLISAKGVRADRPAIKGDYIRIDIPSTEPSFDRGYNWLRIVEIAQNMQSAEPWIALTLRPSGLPRSKDDDIEQFIDHSANSTLMIRRNGFTIYAQEYFGNKVPYKFGDDLYDRKPNLGIALAAKIGLSYIQWKMLVDRLLRD